MSEDEPATTEAKGNKTERAGALWKSQPSGAEKHGLQAGASAGEPANSAEPKTSECQHDWKLELPEGNVEPYEYCTKCPAQKPINFTELPARPNEPLCEKCGNERDPDSCEAHVVRFGHDFVYPKFTNNQLARACEQMAEDKKICGHNGLASTNDLIQIAQLLRERK